MACRDKKIRVITQVSLAAWLFFAAQAYSHKALVFEKTSGQVAKDHQICPGITPDALRSQQAADRGEVV